MAVVSLGPVWPPLTLLCKIIKTILMLIIRYIWAAFVGELRIPHWTKQISWLASVLNVNWIPSLSLIASPLQVYWHKAGELSEPDCVQQTNAASLIEGSAEGGPEVGGRGRGAGRLCDLADFEIAPSLSPNPHSVQISTTAITAAAPSPWWSGLRPGHWGNERCEPYGSEEPWCKSAHALHQTVCQAWV